MGPCRVLNKRFGLGWGACSLQQRGWGPAVEGIGLCWCWGDQQKDGVIGPEKGEVCVWALDVRSV